jgi:RpiR family carbohydrate utilization transcriptional regulator
MKKPRRAEGFNSPPKSVSGRLSLLSPKRQETIRPALEQPREFVLLSVRALAERLGTDPATTVRIVRGMGFGSYREFQHYLHELSIARATSLDTMQTGIAGKHTLALQAKASLDQDSKSLTRLSQNYNPKQIAKLVERIYSARQIVLLGGDLAANLVNFFEHLLIMLGLPVSAATTPAESVHKARLLTKRDLVIAITFGRGLRQTVEGLRQSQENHAYCVGITDTAVSPICQFANECLFVPVDAPSFGPSYVAPMALLNLIVVACANHKRARTLSILKKVQDEQRHGFRWYES